MRGVIVNASNLEHHRAGLETFHRGIDDFHFSQTLDWYSCHVKHDDMFFVLTLKDGNVLASSLIRRRHIPILGYASYQIDRGPVCPDFTILVDHLKHISEVVHKDGILVRANPYYHDEDINDVELLFRKTGWIPLTGKIANYSSTIILDLSQEVEMLRGELRRSLRTQINKGQRMGVKISEQSGLTELKAFVFQYNEMAHKRGLATISPHTQSYLHEWISNPCPRAKLLTAEYQGEQVAGIVLLSAGNHMIYEWGVCSEMDIHRQLPLTHMLHWRAILWAKENGYRYYDFGGYWEARGDKDPINRFKTGFSKVIRHHVPEQVLLLKPLAARAYLTLARAKVRVNL